MGHHVLRHDKECQNCGHTVEVEYCSKCGQQNTETRQSFHHLITHMFEDITHYDGNFWKTIKYLLFRPGKLTSEYLMGHRMRYVPPVKLYIFISFVCFFLMAIMAPDAEEESASHSTKETTEKTNEHGDNKNTDSILIKNVLVKNEHQLDSLQNALPKGKKLSSSEYKVYKALFEQKAEQEDDVVKVNNVVVHNVHELDSVQDALPKEKKLGLVDYYDTKLDLKSENLTKRDIIIGLAHTIPKVLFIYMPLFAFWLWLFHGKRRWYFFDHGIFTLHYFSFLLLLITIDLLLGWLTSFMGTGILSSIFAWVTGIFVLATLLYPVFYFFRSHSRFYGERKAISRLKSLVLFFINAILIIILSIGTTAYVLLHTH